MQLPIKMKMFKNWDFILRQRAAKYTTQDQVEISCVIKYINDFKVASITHPMHPFIIA